MSTQTLTESARQLATAVLIDQVQMYTVGSPITEGINVTHNLVEVGDPIPGLVQTTTLAYATESLVVNIYSVKVAKGTSLFAGMAVKVLRCIGEPDLVGKTLLIDKVSQNGLSMIRKALATDATQVNQEGKDSLS